MIKLRTSGQKLDDLVNKFIRPLTKDTGEAGLLAIQVYYHATFDTDLSIHIHWDTTHESLQKTRLGSCIVNTLEDFGLTYHTLWIEEADNSKPTI